MDDKKWRSQKLLKDPDMAIKNSRSAYRPIARLDAMLQQPEAQTGNSD